MSIIRKILASPEGGTIALNGKPLPEDGYFVGGLVSPLILEVGDTWYDPEDEEQINTFAQHLIDPIGATYLGWWTDEETGKLWIDGTTWHATEFEAGRIGRERGEIAIYDVRNQRELRLAYVDGELEA